MRTITLSETQRTVLDALVDQATGIDGTITSLAKQRGAVSWAMERLVKDAVGGADTWTYDRFSGTITLHETVDLAKGEQAAGTEVN